MSSNTPGHYTWSFSLNGAGVWFSLLFDVAGAAILVFILARFGPLAMAATLFLNNFASSVPLDLRSGTWYFGHGLFGFAVGAALAIYGFRMATVGQPLFAGMMEE